MLSTPTWRQATNTKTSNLSVHIQGHPNSSTSTQSLLSSWSDNSGKMNGWLHCTHTIQLQVNSVSQSKTDQHTTGVMFVPHSWDVECRKTDGRSTGGTLLLNFYLCCNCVPGQSEIRNEFSNGYWGYLGLTPQCCCWWKVLLVTIFDEIL